MYIHICIISLRDSLVLTSTWASLHIHHTLNINSAGKLDMLYHIRNTKPHAVMYSKPETVFVGADHPTIDSGNFNCANNERQLSKTHGMGCNSPTGIHNPYSKPSAAYSSTKVFSRNYCLRPDYANNERARMCVCVYVCVYVCVCVSVCLSVCLSLSLAVCLSVCLCAVCRCECACVRVCVCVCVCVRVRAIMCSYINIDTPYTHTHVDAYGSCADSQKLAYNGPRSLSLSLYIYIYIYCSHYMLLYHVML